MRDDRVTAEKAPGRRRFVGLSVKLLVLTIVFVMLSEILIFVPSVANFRITWLKDKLGTAQVAAMVLGDPSVEEHLSEALRHDLLMAIGAEAVAIRAGGMRKLLAMEAMPPPVNHDVDLRELKPLASIAAAFDTLIAGEGRMIRVIGEPPKGGDFIELVLAEGPLREAMLRYSRNIMVLSFVISVITAALVFLSLNGLLIRPMRRLTAAMGRFSEDPEDASRIIEPGRRGDEVGLAEQRLADMQRQLTTTLKQQRRLAELGLAVSKINHDLRNLLASAQLFSDRLTGLPDPTVQRFAPKLIGALDRAIAFCQSTLAYGRAEEKAPERRLILLRRLIDDVAETLGLPGHGAIRFENRVAGDLEIDADPDQLFRVLLNLCRNSLQALEASGDPALVSRLAIDAERRGTVVAVAVSDTGPGVPEKARANLFRAFQGSARPGGTGLGLAISAELVHAHGGTITLAEDGPGARFVIELPDRPIAIDEARKKQGRG